MPGYQMRPAGRTDHQDIADLVHSRARWLNTRSLSSTAAADPAVLDLLGGIDTGTPMTWVLCRSGQVVGCAALIKATSGWGWPARCRRQPALTLTGLITAPQHRADRPGRLMTSWFTDYAARQDGVQWLRGCVTGPRLMREFRDGHGWDVVENGYPSGPYSYLMQRRATLIDSLTRQINGAPDSADGTRPGCAEPGEEKRLRARRQAPHPFDE
ncbi:hypothetical protein AB0I49_16940 [Streptomyces sp. NPDC050617]|uniref:hypothetical protein n=1 Tax=Streptomyces sp. NPDC050617 TaxID=3154628 RepID=UPI00343F8364